MTVPVLAPIRLRTGTRVGALRLLPRLLEEELRRLSPSRLWLPLGEGHLSMQRRTQRGGRGEEFGRAPHGMGARIASPKSRSQVSKMDT